MTQNDGIVAEKREIIWQKKCVRREDQVRDGVVKMYRQDIQQAKPLWAKFYSPLLH